VLRKTVYIDAAGSLRSGRPDEPEPDEQPAKPPNADGGARSDPPPGPVDMNQLIREGAFDFGRRWP
jgi:hypothetical protein